LSASQIDFQNALVSFSILMTKLGRGNWGGGSVKWSKIGDICCAISGV